MGYHGYITWVGDISYEGDTIFVGQVKTGDHNMALNPSNDKCPENRWTPVCT